MRTLLALLASCAFAAAQPFTLNDPAFLNAVNPPKAAGGGSPTWPPSTNPTNGFGATAMAWWEPATGAYTTNSSTVTLPNLTAYGTAFDLTNKTASTSWPVGHGNYISFLYSGATFLESIGYTSPPVAEIFLVFAATNSEAANAFYLDSEVATDRQAFYNAGQSTFNAYWQGAPTALSAPVMDKWLVADLVFDADGYTYLYTNGWRTLLNYSGVPTTPGDGMVVGSHNNKAYAAWANMALASCFVFTNQTFGNNTNGFASATRSNAYWYCTNLLATKGLPYP